MHMLSEHVCKYLESHFSQTFHNDFIASFAYSKLDTFEVYSR